MGFWNEFVPEQYKQYVTDATSLKAFVKARDSGDMSAWEASVNYTPPPPVVEQNAAGVKPDPEAVTEIPGTKKVSQPGSSDQFDPNYKPPGWKEPVFQKWNNGRPDVYAYVYDPTWNREIKAKEIKAFKDYDKMISYNDIII